MIEEQTKLIEGSENGQPSKSKKNTKSGSTTAKSRITSKDYYNMMKESGDSVKSAIDGLSAASAGMQTTLAQIKSTDSQMIGSIERLRATNSIMQTTVDQIKASSESVALGLIDNKDEMEKIANHLIELTSRFDRFDGGFDVPPETVALSGDGTISREALDNFKKQIARRDGELADKKFANLMEKMCLMREDYKNLCNNMKKNLANFTTKDIMNSFEAYLIDMENMLIDAGVAIGPYGNDGAQVDVAHQRIVGVVPTSDPSKSGTVANRLSDGYEYNGRAIVKEKVNVYKSADRAPKKSDDEVMEILG